VEVDEWCQMDSHRDQRALQQRNNAGFTCSTRLLARLFMGANLSYGAKGSVGAIGTWEEIVSSTSGDGEIRSFGFILF